MGPLRPEIPRHFATEALALTARYDHKGPFVYFVQAKEGGLVKIGSTRDLPSRLAALQCGSPLELRLRCVVPGGTKAEHFIHKELAHLRHHGEWFGPPEPVQAYAAKLWNDYSVLDGLKQDPVELRALAALRIKASKDELVLIADRYRSGVKIIDIAAEVDASVGYVHKKLQWMRTRGISLPMRQLPYSRPSEPFSMVQGICTKKDKLVVRSNGSSVPPGVDEDAPLW